MGLLIDGTLPVEVKNVDNVLITSFITDIVNSTVIVIYSEMSGETVIKSSQMIIAGNDLLAIVGAPADGSKSLYDNIKDALYAYLQVTLGITGTVS